MLRKISMLLCCLVGLLMVVSPVKAADVKMFNDVYSDDWYARDVYSLVEHGVISGYPDNTFRGDNEITRAEFVTMLIVSDSYRLLSDDDSQVYLSDISNHWAEEYIKCAFNRGYIIGYTDKTFKPDEPITREESFSIIARMVKTVSHYPVTYDKEPFNDENECSDWALDDIRYLHNKGIIKGYTDNTIRPKNNITRGEISSLLRSYMGFEPYDGAIEVTRPVPEPEKIYSLLGTYKITFYCPNGCCGFAGGVTASGNKATPYKTVAMKGIPFGTVIKIEFARKDLQYLNGEYVVEDRGVGSGVVDICIESHSLCYQLGVDRNAKVYIVK